MSDKIPFAEVTRPYDQFEVVMHCVRADGTPDDWSLDMGYCPERAENGALLLNASVEAREREAAAKALEALALEVEKSRESDPVTGTPPCPTGGRYCEHMQSFCGCEYVAKMLRARAAAIRKEPT